MVRATEESHTGEGGGDGGRRARRGERRRLGNSMPDREQQVRRPEVGTFPGSPGPLLRQAPSSRDSLQARGPLQHRLHPHGVSLGLSVPQDCVGLSLPVSLGDLGVLLPSDSPSLWNSKLLAGTVPAPPRVPAAVGCLVTEVGGGPTGSTGQGVISSEPGTKGSLKAEQG